ncbi:MAG: 3-dehydroquinate synthase [Gammaproteobacteria bacterium]|nr:3-dehydroquinate synthase [Gammaproteobacteria bacterium]
MSAVLHVALGARGYPIRIGGGLLSRADAFAELAERPLRLVTDAHVAPRYAQRLRRTLGLGAEKQFTLQAGETHKTWEQVSALLDWLLASRLPRDGAIVALGGGVVGDLAGFAAAVYQRGIDLVQVPTTLLAQVDSSVGGKTGVNHPRGKNLIGAFHQPSLVVIDTATLDTLPPRELSAGLAEVIKYGLLGDAAFFAWLERNLAPLLRLDGEILTQAIQRSLMMKARLVEADEREALDGGARALLNLGHTFAHAIETHTGYRQWLHGEAVAVGLGMAAATSQALGWIGVDDLRRIERLLVRAGLPTRPPAEMRPEHFTELMARDKKVARGRLRLVLLRALGEAVVTADFDPAALASTLQRFCAPSVASAPAGSG